MSKVAVVYTTMPDEEQAVALVRQLLERRLVACGNLFPIRSLYHWQASVDDAREVAVFLKAPAKGLAPLFAAVRELHPYEVPCIEEWDVDTVHAPYEAWVVKEARGARAPPARKGGARPTRASRASAKRPGSKRRGSRSRTRGA